MANIYEKKFYRDLPSLIEQIPNAILTNVESVKAIFPKKKKDQYYSFETGKGNLKTKSFTYGVQTRHTYAVMVNTPEGDEIVVGLTQAIIQNSIPVPYDQIDEVKQGWVYDEDLERFKPKPPSKREALLKGFIWSRTSRTKHKISVTREDSVTLLVECKAKFELDILTKKDPNIDIVTFQNGTIIKNLNPDELERIMIEGASVRSEIESKYAVD